MFWTYSVSLIFGFGLFILTPEVLWVCSEYLWFRSPPDVGWFMLNVKCFTKGGATEAYISFICSPSMLEGELFVFCTCAAECGNVLGPCPKVIGTGPTVLTTFWSCIVEMGCPGAGPLGHRRYLYGVVRGCTGFYGVLWYVTGFHGVLRYVTGFYGVLRSRTLSYVYLGLVEFD